MVSSYCIQYLFALFCYLDRMLSLDWGRALSGQVLFRRFRLVDLVELPVKPPSEENSENPLSSVNYRQN